MRIIPLSLLLSACAGEGADSGTLAPPCEQVAGNVCTWAGTGDAGYDGGGKARLESMFYYPMGLTFSPYGKPILADWNNHKLRRFEDDGTISTVMGTEFIGDGPPDESDQVEPGAAGDTVNLNHPTQQIYTPDGMLMSASWHTHKLRSWDPETGLVLVALGGLPGFAGEDWEDASTAKLNQPKAVLATSEGDYLIIDMRNERIREWRHDGTIGTIVGTGDKDFCGDDGPGLDACLSFPKSENPLPGGAIALSSDERLLYIADTENHRIRVYDRENDLITTIAGTGEAGFSGDGGAASAAQLNYPRDLALVDDTLLYVADTSNNAIRRIDLSTGMIETIIGDGSAGNTGDDGPAEDATLNNPFAVSLDLDGNIYVSDTYNHVIRVIWMEG